MARLRRIRRRIASSAISSLAQQERAFQKAVQPGNPFPRVRRTTGACPVTATLLTASHAQDVDDVYLFQPYLARHNVMMWRLGNDFPMIEDTRRFWQTQCNDAALAHVASTDNARRARL
jgi:hypothetical protein